jgi:hypothetical protein
MTSFNSPSLPRSPVYQSMEAPNYGFTRFESLLSGQNTGVRMSQPSFAINNCSPQGPKVFELGRKSLQARMTPSVVHKVVEELDSEGLLAVEVFSPDGRCFNKLAFLRQICERERRHAKKYREEIEQVNLVTEELDNLVLKARYEKQNLEHKREELIQRRFETEDIEFIRESRFSEIRKVKQKLCQSVLESSKGESYGYLTDQSILHRRAALDPELVKMKCAVHLADKTDPEVLMLVRQANLLIESLKGSQET